MVKKKNYEIQWNSFLIKWKWSRYCNRGASDWIGELGKFSHPGWSWPERPVHLKRYLPDDSISKATLSTLVCALSQPFPVLIFRLLPFIVAPESLDFCLKYNSLAIGVIYPSLENITFVKWACWTRFTNWKEEGRRIKNEMKQKMDRWLSERLASIVKVDRVFTLDISLLSQIQLRYIYIYVSDPIQYNLSYWIEAEMRDIEIGWDAKKFDLHWSLKGRTIYELKYWHQEIGFFLF